MMTAQSSLTCTVCDEAGSGAERVRYYPRQLLTADDLSADQEYSRLKLRRHNRFLHGYGVVCGFAIEAHAGEDTPWRVRVCPGYALSAQGEEIYLGEPIDFDLGTGTTTTAERCLDARPCPNATTGASLGKVQRFYLAVRHTECNTRPERVEPAGCGCSEAACEYSRVRDAVELRLLSKLPGSHTAAPDLGWVNTSPAEPGSIPPSPTPTKVPNPECPPCYDDPWIVLGSILLPANRDTPVRTQDIDYAPRRVVLSASHLRLLMSST